MDESRRDRELSVVIASLSFFSAFLAILLIVMTPKEHTRVCAAAAPSSSTDQPTCANTDFRTR